MQRNKLTSERYPNTTLYLAKECLGFLSKHSEVDISVLNKGDIVMINGYYFEALKDFNALKDCKIVLRRVEIPEGKCYLAGVKKRER